MDKIQMIKMLLDACGNAGEGAAKLAILYFSMDMAKFALTLLLWAAVLVCSYKFFRHLISACNPPGLEQTLIVSVRDELIPSRRGRFVDDYERRRVTAALTKAWSERPKT